MDLRHAGSDEESGPLYGISEWQCWYGHYDIAEFAPETVIDECVDAHLEAGFNHLVWNAGRSTVTYESELPHTTRLYERSGPNANAATRAVVDGVFELGCPLRRALERCRKAGAPMLARLCMNRHYGVETRPENTSHFAGDHPEYQERDRAGNINASRLCYAIEEVQRERIDILLELQCIGVDGLVLDFCRQMPHLRYHPELVEPYIRHGHEDPREIDSADPDDFRGWYRYRAGIMTDFMRRLRTEVRRAEKSEGRSCPVVARVPDGGEWLMPAYGLDVGAWLEEDLVDAVMLSAFPITFQDLERHYDYHVDLAHRHGKSCIGGLGSRGLFLPTGNSGRRAIDPVPEKAYEVMRQQFDAGCDAMSVYQTETLARLPELQHILRDAADPRAVAEGGGSLTVGQREDTGEVGLDWHSFRRGLYGVGTSVEPQHAL
jgi:hypothetical protein